MPAETPAPNLDRLRDQRMVRILGDVRLRLSRLRQFAGSPRAEDPRQGPRTLKLLVGYEETAQGHDALALGAVLGQTIGATVLVANVVPPGAGFVGARDHRREVEEAGRRLLAGLPPLPQSVDVAVEARCLEGSPVSGLRRLAAEEGADVIVLGSTHRGPVGRVLPGSVGGRLLGRSPCPVAVAPRGYANADALACEDPRPRVIGVGYDGSPEAEEALRVAAGLAGTAAAALRVVAVGEPFARGPAAATAETQAWSIQASYRLQDRLQEVVAGLPGDLRPQPIYLRGDPAALLVEAAEKGIDLLVIGARSRGPLRSLPGSVCSRVMREAPCPVVVVPGGPSAAQDPSPEATAVPPRRD
jgi:nucleotide-binding universal stress UspA family protein